MNIFVTGDDRKEPLRYKEPLLHTVMFFFQANIEVNGFLMVFKILRAMVDDAFEVNDGCDGTLWTKMNDSGGDEVAV